MSATEKTGIPRFVWSITALWMFVLMCISPIAWLIGIGKLLHRWKPEMEEATPLLMVITLAAGMPTWVVLVIVAKLRGH